MDTNRLTCLFVALCLAGCGGGSGGGSPTAATPTPTPTASAPVSVTVNLRIGPAPTASAQDVSITNQLNRQVRIQGDITANRGYADVDGNIAYFTSAELPIREELPLPIPSRLEAGVPFNLDTVLNLHRPWSPDGFGDGTFTITLMGTGQDGTAINVQQSLPFLAQDLFVDPAPCTPDDTTICALQDRFKVEVTWKDFAGQTGPGHVQTDGQFGDGGYFWFFQRDNQDLLAQVTDQCASRNQFWVFLSSQTNVDVTVMVTDTKSGFERIYNNSLGTPFQPVLDTEAFATCP